MSTSIHQILEKGYGYFDELKLFLERDPTSVNQILDDQSEITPLHRVLMSEYCSLDNVKLLLQYGADVRLVSRHGTCLFIALLYHRDKDIIKLLLEGGSDVNVIEKYCHERFTECYDPPPLFLALREGASAEVIQMLLEYGSSLIDSSGEYESVFHCDEDTELKTDVCKLLLDAGAGVNHLDMFGRSVLCIALRRGGDVEAIKMLLDAGCSTSDCMLHDSAWLCSAFCTRMLKVDVLNLLLDAGVNISVDYFYKTPLQCALKHGVFETSGIKLLFDLEIGDVKFPKSTMHKNLLLHAIMNRDCKLSIVKLLMNRGARVDVVDHLGNTPLHLAVLNYNCKPDIVKFLIEKGASVNQNNKLGRSPLSIALESAKKLNILNLLLRAGARFHRDMLSLLHKEYHQKELCIIFKMFLKYAFLENISFESSNINLCNSINFQDFLDFGTECVRELQNMHSKNIGHGCTLHQFINRCTELQINEVHNDPEAQKYDFNQLLKILTNNTFPVYFDVISFQVSRNLMETKLLEMRIYTVKTSSNFQSKVVLNHECVCKIAQFLSNYDLLRFILAFYIPVERLEDK